MSYLILSVVCQFLQAFSRRQYFCFLYDLSLFFFSDPTAPLRITIKQEKEDVHNRSISPNFTSSTPPTPSTPSPQAPPTPSPPPFMYESELSDSNNDDEYEPNASEKSFYYISCIYISIICG